MRCEFYHSMTALVSALPVVSLVACGAGSSDLFGTGAGTNAPTDQSASGGSTLAAGGSTNGGSGAAGSPAGNSGGAANSSGGAANSSGGAANSGGPGGSLRSGGALSTAGAGNPAGSASTGGTSSAAPASPYGGAGSEPDCNSVTGQPIVTVAADGSGDHRSVEGAVEAVDSGNTTLTQIRIKPGIYEERFILNTPHITLCGELDKEAETVIVRSGKGTTKGYTISVQADGVSFENTTIQNTVTKGQAPALMTERQRTQFRNCRILGYQDTLYARSETQYYRNCYIEGRVDYVFGGATAVYQNCEVKTIIASEAIAAPNTKPGAPFGLVFLGGKATAAPDVAESSQHLARTWGEEGSAHFIGTSLGAHLNPTGWAGMHSERVSPTARFGEYGSTGPGAHKTGRDPLIAPMTEADAAKFTLKNIFGSWTPSFSED